MTMKLSHIVLICAVAAAIPAALIGAVVALLDHGSGVFVGILSFIAIFGSILDWLAKDR